LIVAGPPWRMTIVTLYTLHAGGGGHRLRSEGVQVARLAWGRITAETILPGTQRVSSHLAAPEGTP